MTPTVMETSNNIDRLLAMLDHPERYSEQEIMDTVNHDDETREFYRSLTQAARAASAAIPYPWTWTRHGSNSSKRIWQRKSTDACGKE